jgi:zinc transport system substrate-binding protein
MMFSRRLGLLTWLGLSFALIAWTESHAKPTAYVVNYPLQYFTERIGAEHVQVMFPAPADEDPAFWKPDANTIAAFQAADLIIINGATYAKWLKTASLPKAKMVDTSEGFKANYIDIKDTVTHSHGPGGEHSHAGTAFTTWLDFRQAAQQAQAITAALSRLLPEQQHAFEQRYAELAQDLLALDQRLEAIVAKQRTQPLVASHPVYQYLARRYGLNLQSVLWEPEVMPDDEQWQALQSILKTHTAKWMLWEGDPLQASVDKLQTLEVKSLVFDPCGNVPEQGDFLSVMKQNVENLQQAFQ